MAGILGAIGTGATIAIVIKGVDKFSSTFAKANTGVDLLKKTALLGVSAMAGFGTALTAVGISATKIAGDFEQTQVAFTTMLGSAEEANKFLKELADFARKTPFTLQGVEKSAKQLMAVGFEAEDVIPTLKNVGDIASGLGLGEEGLQRLILNLGQVQTQGKLTGRELRDFSVAGVPLLQVLADQLGKTTVEIQEMISKGEISSNIVNKAFESMASEGGKFANLMDKQSKTVQGRFSNLKDTVTLLMREIGQSLLPVVGRLVDVFLDDVLPAIEPLIPLIGDALVGVLEELIPHLPDIIEGFTKIVKLGLKLFQVLSPLIGPILDITLALLDFIDLVLTPITPALKILVDLLRDVWKFLEPIAIGLTKISGSLIGSILGETSRIGSSALRDIFGGLKETFVGDAIIRPNGEIIRTHPKDTLVATRGGMGMVINITGPIYGTDPDDIAEALQNKLNNMIIST